MTQAQRTGLHIAQRSIAADTYETDSSTGVIEDSLDVIEELGAYNEWVYELLEPHVEGRVLEIGCGTGNIHAVHHAESGRGCRHRPGRALYW